MQNKNKIKWLIVLVGIIIILFVFMLAKIVKVNNQCQKNPFVFGARNIADQGIKPFCSCTFIGLSGRQTYSPIYFDEDGITQEEIFSERGLIEDD